MTNMYIIFITTPLFILKCIPSSLFITSKEALSLIILKSIYGKNVYWKKFNSSPNNIWAIIDEKANEGVVVDTYIDNRALSKRLYIYDMDYIVLLL